MRHGDSSQRWFKEEVEEQADVRSYNVRTEDGRILRRDRRHLRRSREPFYPSQPGELPVTLPSLCQSATPEKPQRPQSMPTTPRQEDQPNEPDKPLFATPSKDQPLCAAHDGPQPVKTRITRAGRLSKPPGYLKDYV